MRRRAVLAIALLALAAPALAQNGLTVGSLTTNTGTKQIAYKAAYTGDANADATVGVRFKKSSDSAWSNASNCGSGCSTVIIDRRATIANTNDNTANQFQARGVIIGLRANTSYDLEVTWTDADGVTGTNPVTGTASTQTETPPTGGTAYYINSATGLDANNGLTSGAAWLTMAHALASSVAGDLLNCNGTFAAFTFNVAGTSGAYRLLQNESGQSCTIAGSATTHTLTVSANFVWLKGLTVNPSSATTTGASANIGGTSRTGLYVTGVTIPDVATNEADGAGGGGNAAGILCSGCTDVYILNNAITRTTTTSGQEGVDGICPCGNGNLRWVIDGNTLTGGFWDMIGNNQNSSLSNWEAFQISNNTGRDWYDDGVETDGSALGLAVWGNDLRTTTLAGTKGQSASPTHNGADVISLAGDYVTPSYLVRNYIVATGTCIKSGHADVGYVYLLHNSFSCTRSGGYSVSEGSAGGTGFPGSSPGPITSNNANHTWRNNILATGASNVWQHEGTARSGVANDGNTYDYDLAWCTSCSYLFSWNDTTNYATWALFKTGTCSDTAGCQEVHSVNADPAYDASYHIGSGSPAKDVGVAIDNINTADSCWPAQGAGADIGAYEVNGVTGPACSAATAAPVRFRYLRRIPG